MKPDYYIFEPAGGEDSYRATVEGISRRLKEHGATFVRFTVVGEDHKPLGVRQKIHGFWGEGWKSRPKEQGEFDPPLTLATGGRAA